MMNGEWKKVKLGEVLTPAQRAEAPVAGTMYRQLGVRLWGEGAYERDPVDGAQTTYSHLFRAETDDVVVNKIWARNGSVALVQPTLAGAYGSTEFPMFAPKRDRLMPRWMHWLTKTSDFWFQCDELSKGTSGKNRIKPSQFLQVEIPLPPLAEQRRIVARIEDLTAQIAEARMLRLQAMEETVALLVSMAHRTDLEDKQKERAGWRKRQLRDCIDLVDDSHKVSVDRSYPNFGIYSYARGLFHKPPIEGIQTSAPTLRRVKAGQFIYSRLFAFEGAYGLVADEYDGHYVSSEYPTFICKPDAMRVEFLEAYFKSPSAWREVAVGSKGLGSRRQRVQPAQVLSHCAWVPPLTCQDQIVRVRKHLDALKRLQAETAAELDALMPPILDRAFKGEL